MQAEQRTILVGKQRVVYAIRKSRRAKNLIINLDHDGSVEVIVPRHSSLRAGEKFLRQKLGWLEQGLTKQRVRGPKVFHACQAGETIPFLGSNLTVVIKREAKRKRSYVKREGSRLILKLPSEEVARLAVEKWYRRQAREYFLSEAKTLAAKAQVRVNRVRIGNYRSQWGSASSGGVLSFNWRLLLGPKHVAQYLVAHEVAHLIEPNHSRRYWQIVRKLKPDYEYSRRWLRQNSSQLSW